MACQTMTHAGLTFLSVLLLIPCAVGVRYSENWMAANWHSLQSKSLLNVTLPGSHNSGNYAGGLSASRLCMSEHKYYHYIKSVGKANLDKKSFDRQFLKWNINHQLNITEQLHLGTRWFHLKLCNFNPAGADMDLHHVLHTHRGYTSISLAEMLEEMRSFLFTHPKEFLALGFNNLANNASSFFQIDLKKLAVAVEKELAKDQLVLLKKEDLLKPLGDLLQAKRRVAAFFPFSLSSTAIGIKSSESLHEHWHADMESGDLSRSQAWLAQEFESYAIAQNRNQFYVMQANPNHAEKSMFDLVNSAAEPSSLRSWLEPFLQSLEQFVLRIVAENPQIRINAVSTDHLHISRPFDIAMQLNGLPKDNMEMHSNAACLNPAIISGEFEDIELDASRYKLHAAYVMQRHCDRWIYAHDYINNTCWTGQLDSSKKSSPLMANECLNVPHADGLLKTVWQTFPEGSDPYAKKNDGECQVHDGTPQGSHQGLGHSRKLGEMLKKQYVPRLVPAECPPGAVALHADYVHKNQLTLQTEYLALCKHLPDLEEFPLESTLVGYIGGHKKGTPWYVQKSQCKGARLDALTKQADTARLNSRWWNGELQQVASAAAAETGHNIPENEKAAEFLDNIIDCVAVHACTGLEDTPGAFLDSGTGLPGLASGSLYESMNLNETAKRTWNFDYYRADSKLYREYASLDYGYFFAVLSDQLRAALEGNPRAPKLTITVMSDSNLSPQLAFYNLPEKAKLRPPYLSTLIHEVYEDVTSGNFSIRVLFNGKVLDVCSSPGSFPLCPLHEWEALIAQYIPDEKSCPALYEGYDFLTQEPGTDFPNYAIVAVIGVVSLGVCLVVVVICRSVRRASKESTRNVSGSTTEKIEPAGTDNASTMKSQDSSVEVMPLVS